MSTTPVKIKSINPKRLTSKSRGRSSCFVLQYLYQPYIFGQTHIITSLVGCVHLYFILIQHMCSYRKMFYNHPIFVLFHVPPIKTWYNPCFYDQNTILTSSNTCCHDKITILTLSNPCCHDKLQLWLCQIPVVMIRSPFWLCQIPVVMIISPIWLCQIPVVMIKSPFWLCQIPLIKTSPFWLCLTSVVTTKITILTLSNPCHENITILTLSSPCHDKITILTLSNPCCHDKIQSWRLTNVSFLNTPTSQRLASASQPHFSDGDLARCPSQVSYP